MKAPFLTLPKNTSEKADVVIQALLILAIAAGLAITVVPWIYHTINLSMDSAEMKSVKTDMIKCSDKILETARTGSGNKCILGISRGELQVKTDGIYYSLLSGGEICSTHDWALVERQVWQKCSQEGSQYNYQLKWFYPKNDAVLLEGTVNKSSVSGYNIFTLENRGTLFVEFSTPESLKGNTIELTRYYASENTTVLSVNVY